MADIAKTTINGLTQICNTFTTPETFMTNRGFHFNNNAIRSFCTSRNITPYIMSTYPPWINGLVEGTNGKLLGWLKRLYALNLGKDKYSEMSMKYIPQNWLDQSQQNLVEQQVFVSCRSFEYISHHLLIRLASPRHLTPVFISSIFMLILPCYPGLLPRIPTSCFFLIFQRTTY